MNTAVSLPVEKKQRVKTLWISDLHLGTRGCQAEKLATFLKSYDCDHLYLVGDIIDGCAKAYIGLSRTPTWCAAC